MFWNEGCKNYINAMNSAYALKVYNLFIPLV